MMRAGLDVNHSHQENDGLEEDPKLQWCKAIKLYSMYCEQIYLE